MSDQRKRAVLYAGGLAVMGLSVLVATQNFYALGLQGRSVPWLDLFLGEIPVWSAWLAMLPVIVRLADRFPPHRPPAARNVTIHLLAGCAAVYVMLLFTAVVRQALPGAPPFQGLEPLLAAVNRSFPVNLVPFLIVYAAVTALAVAWQYHEALQARAVRESQLETQLARTRLDVLRAQIQPHFLFNSLHAISALMNRDVNAARRMMRRLSELLRIALDDSDGDEVELSSELEFLDRYLDIQRLRFPDRLTVELDIGPGTRSMRVPRLILQPVVENAIKHGIAGRVEAGTVRIETEQRDGALFLRVIDDGPGFPDEDVRGGAGGVGLANTRERLSALYGSEGVLEVLPGPGATVEIRIPARREPR